MDKREVIKRAEQFCKDNQINEYPVGIIELCQKQGIKVFEEYLDSDVSGFIIINQSACYTKYKTGKLIVVNASDSARRKRFTVAHELAHYILHRKDDGSLYAHRDAGQYGSIEHEANLFAAAILMPEDLVYDSLSYIGKSLPFSIKAECISRDFAVSLDAARVRLKQLGIS